MGSKLFGNIVRKYYNIIIDFIESNGNFILLTRDNNFIRLIETLVIKEMGVKKRCIYIFFREEEVIDFLKGENEKGIFFIERIYEGNSTDKFIQNVKSTFENISIIVLTAEVKQEILVHFYESGADNFITKPISLNSLVEKIAFTLKPPTKIGKLLDSAKMLIEKGQYEKAIRLCKEVLSIKPNSPSALLIMGDAYKGMGRVKDAVDCYLDAHKSATLYLEPLKRLASIFEELKDRERQLKYLLKLDKLNPLNVERKIDIGCIHAEIGKKDEAQRYFDQALRIISKEARDKVSNLAVYIADRLMNFDPKLAEEYYYKALKVKGEFLDISDVETINRLGICLRQQKRPKEAIREYVKALKILPNNPSLLYNIAIAYLEAGEYKNALAYTNRLFKVAPDFYKTNEVVCYNIAMVFYKIGDTKNTSKFLKECLRINSDYKPAKKFLERLSQN